MEEHDFEASRDWKSFSRDDLKKHEHLPTLALALWGRMAEDLRQQLLAPTPQVPRGCTLADLQALERQTLLMLKSPTTFPKFQAEMIVVANQTFNGLEARYEVIRRAIKHLERRG